MTRLTVEQLLVASGVPEGVDSLRRLILELAVRGRLLREHETITATEQADEGPIRRHALPKSWTWLSLGSASRIVGGGTPRAGEPAYWAESGLGIPWVTPADLNGLSGKFVNGGRRDITERGLAESSAQLLTEGTVLFSSRAPIGYVAIAARPIATNQGFKSIAPSELLTPAYVYWYMKWCGPAVDRSAPGTTFREISGAALSKVPIAIPPLDEQNRIVAKVDELMALCDRLEAREQDAEAAHRQLVQVLLDRLMQARDAEEFRESWERVAVHFDVLFTTESSVEALKGFVMQAAVEGRLVGGAARGEWRTATIDTFCTVQGGIQKTPLRAPVRSHYPYLRVANVQRGRVDVAELERYELAPEELERWRLHAGDLLIVEGNGSANEIGRCAIWRGEVEDCVYQNHLIRVRPTDGDDVEYLEMYLNSPVGTAHMRRLAITTSGLFNLSVGKIRSIPVELPPKETQAIIVAEVRQLLSLCDGLATRISAGRSKHAQLAEALVAQALTA